MSLVVYFFGTHCSLTHLVFGLVNGVLSVNIVGGTLLVASLLATGMTLN